MLPREPVNDGGDQPTGYGFVASNAQFPRCRIGKKFDVFHALPQLVEDDDAALQERAAIERRLHALWTTIKQRHAEGAFQVRDGLRYDRPRNREALGSLAHVAVLGDGHEDVEVARPKPATDAAFPVHWRLVPKRVTG